jgi:hypothetical protein
MINLLGHAAPANRWQSRVWKSSFRFARKKPPQSEKERRVNDRRQRDQREDPCQHFAPDPPNVVEIDGRDCSLENLSCESSGRARRAVIPESI